MIQCRCTLKYREKDGSISQYALQDLNGSIVKVTAKQLKDAIREKKIDVINLKLTSDGRLVDTKKELLTDSLFTSGKESFSSDEIQKVAVALAYLDYAAFGGNTAELRFLTESLCEMSGVTYNPNADMRMLLMKSYRFLLKENDFMVLDGAFKEYDIRVYKLQTYVKNSREAVKYAKDLLRFMDKLNKRGIINSSTSARVNHVKMMLDLR